MIKYIQKYIPGNLKKWIKIFLYPDRVVVLPMKPSYIADGFATIHNSGFMEDEKFIRAYEVGENTKSWKNIHWRAHVYTWCASHAAQLEGDFVECGVNRGGYARMVYDYLDFGKLDKKFWLLDTYQGFDESLVTNSEVQRGILESYDYSDCYDEVKETFKYFSNAIIIKGSVPGTLGQVTTNKVAFLSIDMNCVEPEIAAINYFWDKLNSGAIVLLDDYGHPRHQEQKKAFDSFAQEKCIEILHLPCEQGIIIKPHKNIK